jgi:hypothetical protein
MQFSAYFKVELAAKADNRRSNVSFSEFRPECFLSFSESTEKNIGEKSNRFVCYSIRLPVKGLDGFSCCPNIKSCFDVFHFFVIFHFCGRRKQQLRSSTVMFRHIRTAMWSWLERIRWTAANNSLRCYLSAATIWNMRNRNVKRGRTEVLVIETDIWLIRSK